MHTNSLDKEDNNQHSKGLVTIELLKPHHNIFFLEKNAKTQRNNLSQDTKTVSGRSGIGTHEVGVQTP